VNTLNPHGFLILSRKQRFICVRLFCMDFAFGLGFVVDVDFVVAFGWGFDLDFDLGFGFVVACLCCLDY
jgi:hypothetical protein